MNSQEIKPLERQAYTGSVASNTNADDDDEVIRTDPGNANFCQKRT